MIFQFTVFISISFSWTCHTTFHDIAIPPEAALNPCVPNPCGPNAKCRAHNDVAVCECEPGTFGNPNLPTGCQPECVTNSQCPMDEACVNRRCRDPCVGTCGLQALCDVVAHNPICRCPGGYTGDPIHRCTLSKDPKLSLCYLVFTEYAL